jgi:hypothetical protein
MPSGPRAFSKSRSSQNSNGWKGNRFAAATTVWTLWATDG